MPFNPLLLSVGLLFAFSLGLLVIRLGRARFAYFWLLSALCALTVWTLVLLSRAGLSQTFPFSAWGMPALGVLPPLLLLDPASWGFAFSLSALLLAVILTDVVRPHTAVWSTWAAALALTGFGLLTALAGNPLMLILAWAALDFFELLVQFWYIRNEGERQKVVLQFSLRAVSFFFLLWAWLSAGEAGRLATFGQLPRSVGVLLLLAGWVRLSVVCLPAFPGVEPSAPHSLSVLMRLIAGTAGLIPIVRAAEIGVMEAQVLPLLLLAGLVGLVSGISWLFSADEWEGQRYWLGAVSALAVAAAARAQPGGSLVWALAGVLAAGLIGIYSARARPLTILLGLSLLMISGLPFSLTWNAAALYAAPATLLALPLIVVQSLLLAGYFRLAWQSGEALEGAERWVILVYSWGLALLIVAQALLAWLENLEGSALVTPLRLQPLLPGVMASILAVGWVYLTQRLAAPGERWIAILRLVRPLNWLGGLLTVLDRLLGRAAALVAIALEGEGGILWALLWLVLLFAVIARGGLGG